MYYIIVIWTWSKKAPVQFKAICVVCKDLFVCKSQNQQVFLLTITWWPRPCHTNRLNRLWNTGTPLTMLPKHRIALNHNPETTELLLTTTCKHQEAFYQLPWTIGINKDWTCNFGLSQQLILPGIHRHAKRVTAYISI